MCNDNLRVSLLTTACLRFHQCKLHGQWFRSPVASITAFIGITFLMSKHVHETRPLWISMRVNLWHGPRSLKDLISVPSVARYTYWLFFSFLITVLKNKHETWYLIFSDQNTVLYWLSSWSSFGFYYNKLYWNNEITYLSWQSYEYTWIFVSSESFKFLIDSFIQLPVALYLLNTIICSLHKRWITYMN
jgi:hypothetical protein